jgi:5-methylcytosine-specific restriction enzyme subunit McrC
MNQSTSTIELVEYRRTSFERDIISDAAANLLWHDYRKIIEFQPPSIITNHQWQLTSQGWVGYLPLTSELGIRLKPKIPLNNIFGMLEYAYHLKNVQLLEGWNQCETIEEFYERLADILARRILDRVRRGLYRTYIPKLERLTCIRGRIDIPATIRTPWETALKCHYQEQTADIADNQILAWTLHQIIRSNVCTDRTLPKLRQAYRAFQGSITLIPHSAQTCIGRTYHRLNDDYQLLHALCRFFLEQSSPQLNRGDRKMLPFLVEMASLYENFVAQWLKAHRKSFLAPRGLQLTTQVPVYLNEDKSIKFIIDLVLTDIETGRVRYIIDTKYKNPAQPSAQDVQQIIAYAAVTGATEAILLYPQELSQPLNTQVSNHAHNIRVRTLAFGIDRDLDLCGQEFVHELFG